MLQITTSVRIIVISQPIPFFDNKILYILSHVYVALGNCMIILLFIKLFNRESRSGEVYW